MTAHRQTHQAGGSDPIKLDDLARPEDNTDLNATTLRHGLLPKLSGDATEYLDGTGVFSTPTGSGSGNVNAGSTLTARQVVLGDGSTDVRVVGSLGSSGDVLTSQGAGADPQWAAPSGLSASTYLQYRDQQTQNTSGGTFTSGAWQTRTLNTEVADAGNLGTLASNQITLAAGTYYVNAVAPAFGVGRNQLRLQNVTDASTVLVGMSTSTHTAAVDNAGEAVLRGVFTIGASKALELQHQGTTTVATRGFGIEANFTTEVYAVIEFWKLS